MFSLEIEFLASRYVAAAHDDRDVPEWPPHPVRLLYALVDAAGPYRTTAEERALDWLCSQPPPHIGFGRAFPRRVVTAFVPVNDRPTPKPAGVAAAGTIPRSRQPRSFPTMVLHDPVVAFTWPQPPTDEVRARLGELAHRVGYLGHSSSPVRVDITNSPATTNLVPRSAARGGSILRVPAEGLVAHLDVALRRYEATGVRGPLPCDYVAYGPPAPEAPEHPHTVFDVAITLRRIEGPRLPIASAERTALALRDAVLSLVPDPVPEAISGHGEGGHPSTTPHVAFVALPDVGHTHAAGSLAGLAALCPRDIDPSHRAALETAMARLEQLRITRRVTWKVQAGDITGERLPLSLVAQVWRGPARRWATATPIELDRFVPDRLGREAEDAVAESVRRIGLPSPAEVALSPVSSLTGGGHWRDIRRRARGPHRPLVHAVILFDEVVEGPIALGSGRYRGLGLCRPLRTEGDPS